MRVVNLLASISRAGGGIAEVARSLTHELNAQADVDVRTIGLHDEWSDSDLAAWRPSVVQTLPIAGPRAFGYAPRFRQTVSAMQPDVLHCHGLWMYPSVVSHRIARSGLPGLISPHGMLDPWALRNSSWKKQIALALFEHAHLSGAACVHALGKNELSAIRALCPRLPVCVVPNGIAFAAEDSAPAEVHLDALGLSPNRRVLLYLGRIHQKKGLTNLVSAWAAVRKERLVHASDWVLAIAGWDSTGSNYEAQLRRQAVECGVAESVSFPGALFGAAKVSAFRRADAFVLASVSEGMPMTVLEAWSRRLPVIMTPECNISEGFNAGAALCVNPTVQSLKEGLASLFKMSDSERHRMGEAGRRLVEQSFTWTLAAERLGDVYRWLLGGPRPACVDLVNPRVEYSFSSATSAKLGGDV
jgi:glycosyltransferase involved in cell wall biosynthesis